MPACECVKAVPWYLELIAPAMIQDVYELQKQQRVIFEEVELDDAEIATGTQMAQELEMDRSDEDAIEDAQLGQGANGTVYDVSNKESGERRVRRWRRSKLRKDAENDQRLMLSCMVAWQALKVVPAAILQDGHWFRVGDGLMEVKLARFLAEQAPNQYIIRNERAGQSRAASEPHSVQHRHLTWQVGLLRVQACTSW